MKRFYNDPYMQLKITAVNLAISFALSILFYHLHTPGFYHLHFTVLYLALIPVGIYLGGISTVFIHNASHNSFPQRWLNEMCGHLAGTHQLWGFKGWQLIHLVHHQYADHDDMDPHKHSDLTFWQFLRLMPFRSNEKVRERYRDHWGASPRTNILHKRAVFTLVGDGLMMCNLAMWFALCGPAFFLFLFLPSLAMNYFLVADVNYAAHPKNEETGETQVVNLDGTLYYRLANAMWSGIYYHANHHRKPMFYNPKYMPARQTRQQMMPGLDQAA